MSGALDVAMIGMRAQQQALETLAGNISNINTPTYKRIDLQFSELVGANPVETPSDLGRRGSSSVFGVTSARRPSLDTQGRIDPTGNSLDLAIDGTGFIELMGPGGTTLLWRGGTLRVMDDGALATSSGLILKSGISVPIDATELRIGQDGKVAVTQTGSDEEMQIGEIDLVRVIDPAAIERMDGGVLLLRDEVGVLVGSPGEDGLGTIAQSSIERSNVDLNTEMVALLIAQRAYAANAQVARAADEFTSIANGLRR